MLKELLQKLRDGDEVVLTSKGDMAVDSLILKDGAWVRRTFCSTADSWNRVFGEDMAVSPYRETVITRQYALVLLRKYVSEAERAQEITQSERDWLDQAIARLSQSEESEGKP